MDGPILVRSLICHRHVEMGLLCLGSLLRHSADPIRLLLHDDGTLTPEDIERLQGHLDGAQILPRREADERMAERLGRYPHAAALRRKNVMLLKLLDTIVLSDGDVAYTDTDILYVRPFRGLFCWPDSRSTALFMQDTTQAYSVYPWHLPPLGRLRVASRVNAGLMYVRRSTYDLDFIEWFLSQDFDYRPKWIEQTCWAALGSRGGCRLWDPKQVVFVRRRNQGGEQTVAMHFTTPFRNFLPQLSHLADRGNAEGPPVAVRTIPPGECNALQLAQVQLRHRVRDLIGAAVDFNRRLAMR
jgi:hypothetical protein